MKINWKVLSFLCLLFLSGVVQSQSFTYWDSIPVVANSQTLQFPWCGGLNNAQMYRIDLDGDGLKDLFTFDKTSLKYRTYINTGGTGLYQYRYAPQYEAAFPGPFSNWVELFDFNCDGKEDLFTFKNGNIQVWKNDYTVANGLKFTLYDNVLNSKYVHNTIQAILLSAQTQPAFVDIDGDGDLDLLIYGTEVSWYQNVAVENDGRCDTLDLAFASACWGQFSSYGNPTYNKLTFGITCRSTMEPPDTTARSVQAHNGQSLLAIDLDGDGVKDVLIGDVIQNNITAGFNTGTPTAANVTREDTAFPSNTTPVGSFSCNACYNLDLDNDTIKDLLVSPFQQGNSFNTHSAWYYKNTGTNAHPIFQFQSDNYLQSQMIEVGEGSAPVFFDYDGDGLMDIVIGNYGYYNSNYTSGYQTDLSLYRNTGTATAPKYQLITSNYGNLDSLTVNGVYPTFGDLDGDGDMDMLVGESTGHILYFDNIAGPGNPCVFQFVSTNFDSISVGQFATPQLIDVNRDGKLDLLVGRRNGTISYYQNNSTNTVAHFPSTPTNAFFGGVSVAKAGFVTGYSVPFMYPSGSHYEMLVGTESGYLYHYTNIDGNLGGTFTLQDTAYGKIWEGQRSTPSFVDINNDGSRDLVVGNYSGGIGLYKGGTNISVQEMQSPVLHFKLWPNPSNGQIHVNYQSEMQHGKVTFEIYSTPGKLVYQFSPSDTQKDFSIDASQLPAGMYFCKLRVNNTQEIKKLVIEK